MSWRKLSDEMRVDSAALKGDRWRSRSASFTVVGSAAILATVDENEPIRLDVDQGPDAAPAALRLSVLAGLNTAQRYLRACSGKLAI